MNSTYVCLGNDLSHIGSPNYVKRDIISHFIAKKKKEKKIVGDPSPPS